MPDHRGTGPRKLTRVAEVSAVLTGIMTLVMLLIALGWLGPEDSSTPSASQPDSRPTESAPSTSTPDDDGQAGNDDADPANGGDRDKAPLLSRLKDFVERVQTVGAGWSFWSLVGWAGGLLVAQLVFPLVADKCRLDDLLIIGIGVLIYLVSIVWLIVFWPSLTIEGTLAFIIASQVALWNTFRVVGS